MERLEFMSIGNDIYCRRVVMGNTGLKMILTSWFWYTNTECV